MSTAEYSDDRYKNMAQIAAMLIPNARLIQFEGAGHAVAQERPDAVVAAVRGFWQKEG